MMKWLAIGLLIGMMVMFSQASAQIADFTSSKTKGDVRATLEILPDFSDLAITKWDESTFGIILDIDKDADVMTIEGEKTRISKAGKDYLFYEKGKGYEFEIVIKEKPEKNAISFPIETSGLDFLYQGALDKEPQRQGYSCNATHCLNSTGAVVIHRPESVVNSYAAYHSEKSGDYSKAGGKNYQAGKAFHIYRPNATDSKGLFAWADMDIKDGRITITLQQDFIDKAAYPVTIDPIFGFTDIGGSLQMETVDYKAGPNYTMTMNTTNITKISLYTATAGATLKAAVYNATASGGAPSALKGSNTTGVASSAAGWVNFTMSTGALPAGVYFLIFKGTGTNYNTAYDSNVSVGKPYLAESYSLAFSNPFGTPDGTDPQRTSIFATYSIAVPLLWSQNITNSTSAGEDVKHSVYWNSSGGLAGYKFAFCNGSYTQEETNNTGLLSPTGSAILHGIGFVNWPNLDSPPTNAYDDDDDFAHAVGNSTHGLNGTAFYGFNTSVLIPEGATIKGIMVTLDRNETSTTGTNTINIKLSNNSGVSYGGNVNVTAEPTTSAAQRVVAGGSNELWGLTWNTSTANAIWVNATAMSSGPNRALRIEYIGINITYSYNSTYDCSNASAILTNDTWTPMTGTLNWSNVTKSVNITSGATIKWRVWANDTAGNSNQTDTFSYTTTGGADTTPPLYSLNSTNSTLAGNDTKHSLYWTDAALAGFIFSFDNCTGAFTNDTWTAMTGTGNWSNVTKGINSTVGCTIRWAVTANDTTGNWNYTNWASPFSYVTTQNVGSAYCWTQTATEILIPDNCEYLVENGAEGIL